MKKGFIKFLSIVLSLATIISINVFGLTVSAANYTTSVKIGSYATIKNVGAGKMLNVYGSKSANNTNITVYANDNTTGQQVKATSYNGGYYFTFKCSTSRALNIYGTSCKESANVCIWNLTKNGTQLWTIEYVSSKSAYIIRSKSNKDYCLTANGSSNGSNVCIKKYTGSNYQLWTSSLFSTKTNNSTTSSGTTSTTSNTTVTNNTDLSVSSIKTQITSAYESAKKLANVKNFSGKCGTYVKSQLHVLGIINQSKDTDCAGNGNKFYNNVKTGTTSTGYTKTKVSGGASCLANLVKTYGNNLTNIVISYPHQYGYTDSKPGAGHVVFIHAIIDGTVYYSDNYKVGSVSEGGVLTKTVAKFDSAYTNSYGNAIGAIYFHK